MLDPELEFVAEAEDLLETAREGLAQWGNRIGEGESTPAFVDSLFRQFHSLKGMTATVGLEAASRLAHQAEELLDRLRKGLVPDSLRLLRLLEEALLVIDNLVHRRPEAEAHCEKLLATLQEILPKVGASTPQKGLLLTDLAADLAASLTSCETHRLQSCLQQGRTVLLVRCCLQIASMQSVLPELETRLRARGELIAIIPGVPGENGNIDFHLLYSGSASDSPEMFLPRDCRVQVRALSLKEDTPAPQKTAPSRAAGGASGHFIRLEPEKLDTLIDISKNLLLQQGQLKRMYLQGQGQTTAMVERSFQDMERSLVRLQRVLNDARMVPVDHLFQRMVRVVQGIERSSGKSVRMQKQGQGIALDREALEQLHEPLLHLVRNAVDHGIETPQERMACGKPPEGIVTLIARRQNGQIAVEVRDDGQGIDLEKVRAKGCALGIIRSDEPLCDQQLCALLFEAGFSTRETPGDLSGRGVGMDVVRARMDVLGGLVTIDSQQGKGTGITLTLPQHKAIMPVLIVQVGTHHYALGLEAITCVRACSSCGGESPFAESSKVPLIDLRRHLAGLSLAAENGGYQVVIAFGKAQAVLMVDALLGRREAVIRPFGPIADRVQGFSGVAELGDATPLLALDPAFLIREAGRRGDPTDAPLFDRSRRRKRHEVQQGRKNKPPMPWNGPGGGDGQRVVEPCAGMGAGAHFLSFFMATREYALDIINVVEIIEEELWIPIPHTPFGIRGVFLWRDQVVPLFDAVSEGLRSVPSATCRGTILVCMCCGQAVALAVDRVGQIFRDRYGEADASAPVQVAQTDPCVGRYVCRAGQRVGVLDLSVLIDFEKEWSCVQEKDPDC